MTNLYEKLMPRLSPELKPAGPENLKTAPIKRWNFAPFITISREPGSGGRPIAKKVADLTKFTYYNDDLLRKIAKTTHLRQRVIKGIDEKSRSAIQDFLHSLLNPDYVSDVKYVHQLVDVILSLSEQGNAVILGHGSNFVTSPHHGLHVRISAPYSLRVIRAIKFEKVPRRQAKETIKKVDADRKSFVRQYFGKNISSANYYDLVINTARIDIDSAAKLILHAFEHKFPGYLSHYKLLKKRGLEV